MHYNSKCIDCMQLMRPGTLLLPMFVNKRVWLIWSYDHMLYLAFWNKIIHLNINMLNQDVYLLLKYYLFLSLFILIDNYKFIRKGIIFLISVERLSCSKASLHVTHFIIEDLTWVTDHILFRFIFIIISIEACIVLFKFLQASIFPKKMGNRNRNRNRNNFPQKVFGEHE